MTDTSGDTVHTKSRLVLERRHQLIDLNKEYINFDINFECRSVDASKDFEMLVINQEQLNTIDLSNLAMKKTRSGYISGNIVADENRYQNHFLVVRAIDDQPIEVDLDIWVKTIPPKSNLDGEVAPPPPVENDLFQPPDVPEESACIRSKLTSPFYIVCIVMALLIVGGILYWKMVYVNTSKDVCTLEGGENNLPPSKASSVSSRSSKSSSGSGSGKEGLLKSLMKNKTST